MNDALQSQAVIIHQGGNGHRLRAALAVVGALLLGACAALQDRLELATPPASITAPSLRPFADGVWWVLERDLVFKLPGHPPVVVPAGFVTDLASVPAVARSLRSPEGTYSRAAILHDWLYWTNTCPRDQADRIFYRAMLTSGTSPKVARQVYWAVAKFGEAGHREFDEERHAGIPHAVPLDRLDALDDHGWLEVKAVLGKRSPPPDKPYAPWCGALSEVVPPRH